MRSLLTAAVILWFVVSHIAVADDRPSGIPDEAKYVKVDRITDGYDINASMVRAGFAWWYERYAPTSELLEDCQGEAQGARKGLWESEDPMPPWEWRRR